MADAQVTAQLVAHLITACNDAEEWHADLQRSTTYPWPGQFGQTGKPAGVHRQQAPADPYSWMRSILRAAWIPGTPENEAAYLLVLDNALLDRSISRTEGRQLVATAEAAGLSRATVGRLHHDYLRAVATEALADGVVTDDERRGLEAVAATLGLGIPYVEEALAWASAESHTAKSNDPAAGFTLAPGDRVVFTGETSRNRDEWVTAICAAGLASGGVTKSTRLLVAADPDSLSGKAVKARQYGIPVVGEEFFERIFGQYQDNCR